MGRNADQKYQNLFAELTGYEKRGADIVMEGEPASPMQVVEAHTLREDCSYMRDYELNDKGDVLRVCFHKLNIGKKK